MKNTKINEIFFVTFLLTFGFAVSKIEPIRANSIEAVRTPAVVKTPGMNRAPASVRPTLKSCTTDSDCESKNPDAALLNIMDEIREARLKGCESEAKELVRQGINSKSFDDVESEGDAYSRMIDCTLDQAI